MNAVNNILPTLGQGGSGQVTHVRSHTPKSGTPAVEAREKSLTTGKIRDEYRKFPSSRSMSAAETSPYTDASSFSPLERPERASYVFQWRLHSPRRRPGPRGVLGLQEATLPDEPQSTTTPPYHGRITGPVRFVNQLLATWDLEPKAAACILLGFEPSRSAYVNNVLQGDETLTGRDAKDRIVHLIQIRTSLSTLFRDQGVENEWLREPHDALNGKKPMDLLLEGSMENLLLVKEYVELVART